MMLISNAAAAAIDAACTFVPVFVYMANLHVLCQSALMKYLFRNTIFLIAAIWHGDDKPSLRMVY